MHGNGGDVGLHARVADVNFIYPNYVMISTQKQAHVRRTPLASALHHFLHHSLPLRSHPKQPL